MLLELVLRLLLVVREVVTEDEVELLTLVEVVDVETEIVVELDIELLRDCVVLLLTLVLVVEVETDVVVLELVDCEVEVLRLVDVVEVVVFSSYSHHGMRSVGQSSKSPSVPLSSGTTVNG